MDYLLLPWVSEEMIPTVSLQYSVVRRHADIDDLLEIFLARPIFLRLLDVKQLGTTYRIANLEATHSRLAHACGTVHVAQSILDSLERNSPEYKVSKAERLAVLIFCFLHDGVPLPYSHTLDLVKDFFIPNDNSLASQEGFGRKLDKFFLGRVLSAGNQEAPETPIQRALQLCLDDALAWAGCASGDRAKVLDTLAWLAAGPVAARASPHWKDRLFLRQIVDCAAVDADRLDWIVRDSHFLGLGPARTFADSAQRHVRVREAAERILDSFSVGALDAEGNDAKATVPRLALPEERRADVQVLMETRAVLYKGTYEGEAKLILDEMVAHGLWATICRVDPNEHRVGIHGYSNRHERLDGILTKFALLTEPQADELVSRVGPPFAKQLMADARNNRTFAKIDHTEVIPLAADGSSDPEAVAEFRAKMEERLRLLNQARRDMPATVGDDELRRAALDCGIERLRWEEKWALFLSSSQTSAPAKLRLEAITWSILLADDEFLPLWKRALRSRYHLDRDAITASDEPVKSGDDKQNDKMALRSIESFPHVFLNLPFYSGRELELNQRERQAEEALLWRQADNTTSEFTHGRAQEKRSVRIFSPPELAPTQKDVKKLAKLVRSALDKALLRDVGWLNPDF